MAKLIGDQMTNVIVHLVLPFQWGLGGACAEPATKLGTVSTNWLIVHLDFGLKYLCITFNQVQFINPKYSIF